MCVGNEACKTGAVEKRLAGPHSGSGLVGLFPPASALHPILLAGTGYLYLIPKFSHCFLLLVELELDLPLRPRTRRASQIF